MNAPLRNLRVLLEYDGTDFAGWQRQPGQRTVQETLEEAIRTMTGEDARTRAAGRTDAGVHAAGQVVTFEIAAAIPEGGLLRGLNSHLPADVAILDVREMPADFDARLSARGKVYRYTIWNHLVRSPLATRSSWHVRGPLDLPAMRRAAAILVGEHDFAGFRASDCERKTTVRVVRRLDVERQGAIVTVEVEATAFLKNMVRILVGTLVAVGRGKLDEAGVRAILDAGDRTAAGITAPARGLTLLRVLY